MEQPLVRPMGIGRILDRSFQLYRKHFVKLLLIMLILFGPFYLLQSLFFSSMNTMGVGSIIADIQSGASLDSILQGVGANRASNSMGIGQVLLLIFVFAPVFMFGITPVAVASVLFIARSALLGEEAPSVGELLKKAFRRFWPMVGNSLIFAVIMFGLYIGFALVMIIGFVVFSLGAGITQGIGAGSGTGLAIFMVIFMILIIIGFLLGWSFFFIRWGYFLPYVAFAEESIGIGRSWHLTRRSFWRLFLMYFLLSIVVYIFVLIIALLIGWITGGGLFGQLLQSLVSIVIAPLMILPYAISFFDLRARNEGMGMDDLIRSTVYSEESAKLQPIEEHPSLDQFRAAQGTVLKEEPDKKDE
jgi:hypothetical protein